MARNKITIVGAGKVGATATHIAATKQLGDIVLLDIVEGIAKGRALDLAQTGAIQSYGCQIIGTRNWEKTVGSDIIIITSGVQRMPGMVRDELLEKNFQIVKDVSENVAKYCPDSIILVVTNPLDAMVYTAAKVTGFAKNRVIGMAGAVDSARFCYFLAAELGVSVEDVNAVLMGGHSADMVPLPRFSSVAGIPITELLDEKTIEPIVERTRNGGTEIINLQGHGVSYAGAAGVIKMTEAILKDKKTVMSCCAYCDSEYGIGGYFFGVPVVLGKNGVEKIIELDLNDSERTLFEKSLAHIKELAEKVDKLL